MTRIPWSSPIRMSPGVTVTLPMAPGTLPKSKQLRVTVSFENDGGVVQTQEQSVDLGDTSDIQSLAVNLKFEDL